MQSCFLNSVLRRAVGGPHATKICGLPRGHILWSPPVVYHQPAGGYASWQDYLTKDFVDRVPPTVADKKVTAAPAAPDRNDRPLDALGFKTVKQRKEFRIKKRRLKEYRQIDPDSLYMVGGPSKEGFGGGIANQSERSFEDMVRTSKFMQIGSVHQGKGRNLVGIITMIRDDDLYIDFGGKFQCVCRRPRLHAQHYKVDALVKIRLRDFEISHKFLGAKEELTLMEADAYLIGLAMPPRRLESDAARNSRMSVGRRAPSRQSTAPASDDDYKYKFTSTASGESSLDVVQMESPPFVEGSAAVRPRGRRPAGGRRFGGTVGEESKSIIDSLFQGFEELMQPTSRSSAAAANKSSADTASAAEVGVGTTNELSEPVVDKVEAKQEKAEEPSDSSTSEAPKKE